MSDGLSHAGSIVCRHSAQSWRKDEHGWMYCDDCDSVIVFSLEWNRWFKLSAFDFPGGEGEGQIA